MTRRSAVVTAGAATMIAGVVLASGPPRLTLVNTGVRVDYAWPRGAGALMAAAGLGGLAAAVPRRWMRAGASLAALVAAGSALSLFSWRIEADDAGLSARSWLGRTEIPWPEVTRVQSGPERVIVWKGTETQVAVDTASFRPEQRAALDRTLARRLREASQSEPPAR